jgi:RND superfamily putative drug exporter
MAVAVLLGPTVIRLVFVPATMALLGDLNWWVPRWLDTVLPHIDTVLPHVDTVLPGPLAVLRQETEVPIPRPTP